ncbi:MAG: PadR family transcriptional regulator [Xanthobacteraceae bacterium]
MFRHFASPFEGKWAAGRRGRDRFGGGFGGRHGLGGGDMWRARRMLAQGDLRLIALALIAEHPRHGYDIMKALDERTAGWYSPSPGIVYPTLTYLEEMSYVTAQADGAKKLYTITEAGRAYLAENRDFVDAVLDRLASFGDRVSRMRRRFGGDERSEEEDGLPQLVRAALDNLRDVVAKRLETNDDAEAQIVDVLARVAIDLRKS